VSGEAILSVENSGKPLADRGSAPKPAGELTAIPQIPQLVGGAFLPLPKNHATLSAFDLDFWLFGLAPSQKSCACTCQQLLVLYMPDA